MFASYALTFGRGAHRHALLGAATHQGLANIVDQPGLLFVAERRTPFLSVPNILLVGQIFSPAGERLTSLEPLLDGSSPPRIAVSALEAHWGNFALFDASGTQTSVYRDPSGSIAVYHCRAGREDVFVSDAVLAVKLGLLRNPCPDMKFAVHWLQFPFLRTRRTGLDNVTEILPGVRCTARQAGQWDEVGAWRPAHFLARSDAILDPVEAERLLRETALATIPRQISARKPLLQLSGGLDSSIIAACLGTAGIEFSGVNFATRSADGDERSYAHDVARRFGIQLHEIIEDDSPVLETGLPAAFRPATNPLLRPLQAAIAAASNALDSDLVIDGAGGDNLFCTVASAAPILDTLWWAGPRPALASASDIARLAGCTWWKLASATARRALKPRPVWKEDRSFLRPGALLPRPEPHPWLQDLPYALPGKREHVEALVHIQHFLDRGAPSSIGVLHPLMAQPLLELCLRIPSWLWVRGRRDRAVARNAFRELLPQSVLSRRSKGSLEGLLHRAFARLAAEMRDLLMSGELRRSSILDARALEATFQDADPGSDDLLLRITELVALEQWMQSLRALGQRSASGR
jgi:asparagine synthase (glutamine-hydrolysing)